MTDYTPAVSKREPFRDIQYRLKYALSAAHMIGQRLAQLTGYVRCTTCGYKFRAIDYNTNTTITAEGMLFPEPTCADCAETLAAKGVDYAAHVRNWRSLLERLERNH